MIRQFSGEEMKVFTGIRFKLSLVTLVLILFVTGASSFIVTNIMDSFLLKELVRRGFSITGSASTAAGYSILSNDRLALDNLASKIRQYQKDIVYVAMVDDEGVIKAHSDLEKMGELFIERESEVIRREEDGSTVKKVLRMGTMCFEFRTPIIFADKDLGAIYLGIAEQTLIASQEEARKKIILVSGIILTLGVAGVFFLSGFITTPVKRLMEGVLKMKLWEYRSEIKVVSRDELGELTRNFNEMANTIMNQKEKLELSARELEDAYVATVRILAAAIDARDEYTFGHSERVAKISVLIGSMSGLSNAEVRDLEMVCLFHDVGKIKTPDKILHKMAPLNDEEYRLMMKHPEDGADILRLANSLQKHVKAVLHHHEWHNGKGYPHGLKDGQIPYFSSIIAIADAYDAMTSSRPYRKGMSRQEAMQEIVKYKGVQFNPEITDVFVEILKDPKYAKELERKGVYG